LSGTTTRSASRAVASRCATVTTATEHLRALRNRLWRGLQDGLGDRVVLNGHPERRLPNTLNVNFVGWVGADLLEAIPDIHWLGMSRGSGEPVAGPGRDGRDPGARSGARAPERRPIQHRDRDRSGLWPPGGSRARGAASGLRSEPALTVSVAPCRPTAPSQTG
jgi:hypothetical protein